jgi:hypothetical protein
MLTTATRTPGLVDIASRQPAVIDVRGRGLMVGLELGAPDGASRTAPAGLASVSTLNTRLHCTDTAAAVQGPYAAFYAHVWMDGWVYYTGLARQSTDRKALYEAKAGGMNHDVYTSHCTMRVTGTWCQMVSSVQSGAPTQCSTVTQFYQQ